MKAEEFRLILVDPCELLCEAWLPHFAGCENVVIRNCCFEELGEYDCMVSAANSFGLMDGGVDYAITEYFGEQLMKRVQHRILSEFRGEQPVGTSFIVETKQEEHPFLAHTPTMRVPMDISQTDNVYSAMWAMLVAVWNHNKNEDQKISIVACPGLGTATGRMPVHEAARQMAIAYKHFYNPLFKMSWSGANARQGVIKSLYEMNEISLLEQYLSRGLPDDIGYEDLVGLCLSIYCSVDGLPDGVVAEELDKQKIAEAFSALAQEKGIEEYPSMASGFGAAFHKTSDVGHWLEVISIVIFKKGFEFDRDRAEWLLSQITRDSSS